MINYLYLGYALGFLVLGGYACLLWIETRSVARRERAKGLSDEGTFR